jgi:vacuolar-type H+-ATPase subunit F/Vma7
MSENDYTDKIITIGDYSLVLFFEVLGIPGRIAKDSQEAYELLQKELINNEHKLIVISKKQSREFPEDILNKNLSGNTIIFEFPEPGDDGSQGIADKIMPI